MSDNKAAARYAAAYAVALPEIREEIDFWLDLDREDADDYTLGDAIEDAVDHFNHADGKMPRRFEDNLKEIQIAMEWYRPQTEAEAKNTRITMSGGRVNYNAKNWDMALRGVKYMLCKWGD